MSFIYICYLILAAILYLAAWFLLAWLFLFPSPRIQRFYRKTLSTFRTRYSPTGAPGNKQPSPAEAGRTTPAYAVRLKA